MEETIVDLTRRVEKISTSFEEDTSELKKKYLIKNMIAFKLLAERVTSYKGSFGTGYPYYALKEDLSGDLPIIEEQIRYNRELRRQGERSQRTIWSCRGCLERNGANMPDLKQICKPCPQMDKELKPRKVINRLPDMDLWLICEDGHLEEAEHQLEFMLREAGFRTSDVDPLSTIQDMQEIVEDLQAGNMPEKFLPIDVHIMEYSAMKDLIEAVPETISRGRENGEIPYLPIHPVSLRKKWQLDDEAYNYIYDFLAAFREFSFEEELQRALDNSRNRVVTENSDVDLIETLHDVSSKTQRARFQNYSLQQLFLEKIRSWRTLGQKESPSIFKKKKNKQLIREMED